MSLSSSFIDILKIAIATRVENSVLSGGSGYKEPKLPNPTYQEPKFKDTKYEEPKFSSKF